MRISLGNDIVDFSVSEAQEKYKDARFLARVFGAEEINAILQAKNKDRMLWALWSAKEAAFKACQKRDLQLVFSLKKFLVSPKSLRQLNDGQIREVLLGTIHHHQQDLAVQWHWPDDHCVHCCAVLTENNSIFAQWSQIQQRVEKCFVDTDMQPTHAQQSTAVRKLLIAHLEPQIGSDEELHVVRDPVSINGVTRKGPPILFQGKEAYVGCDISLSHDYGWVAICVDFLLT